MISFLVNQQKQQRSKIAHTDMRRSLDQLLQELVVAKAQEQMLPELEKRLAELEIPIQLIEDKVKRMVRDRAEHDLREQVHNTLVDVFNEVGELLQGEYGREEEPGRRLISGDKYSVLRPTISPRTSRRARLARFAIKRNCRGPNAGSPPGSLMVWLSQSVWRCTNR